MFKSCLTAVLGTAVLGVAAAAVAADTGPSPEPAAHAATSSVTLPPDESVSPAARKHAAEAAAAAAGPDMSRIQEINHADGSTEWVFNGQSEETMSLVRDAQGKPSVRCNGLDAGHPHGKPAAEVSHDER